MIWLLCILIFARIRCRSSGACTVVPLRMKLYSSVSYRSALLLYHRVSMFSCFTRNKSVYCTLEEKSSIMSSLPNVVVLGAGVSGLSTAYEFLQAYPDASCTVVGETLPGDEPNEHYASYWVGNHLVSADSADTYTRQEQLWLAVASIRACLTLCAVSIKHYIAVKAKRV